MAKKDPLLWKKLVLCTLSHPLTDDRDLLLDLIFVFQTVLRNHSFKNSVELPQYTKWKGEMAENGISYLVLLFKKTFKIHIKCTVEDKRIKEMRY